MRPPVEKTRSLLAEDAGIARTMRAILASRGKAFSWSFQKASTSTLGLGLGSVSYLRISCSRHVSLPTSPLSLLKVSLEVGEREGLGKSTSRASSPCWSKYEGGGVLGDQHGDGGGQLGAGGQQPGGGLGQGSRREFSSLNLRVRDENEIFFALSQGSRRQRDVFLTISGFETRARFFSLNISGFETRVRYFLSKSHVSRWERDMQTNFSRSSEKKWT